MDIIQEDHRNTLAFTWPSLQDRVDQVKVFLHVNGFRFRTEHQEVSISLSPFTLVRNCKFQPPGH